MDRFVLTDAQWAKMEPLCLGKPGDPGRSGKDNRLFVGAVLWIVRAGSPWRDLPPAFGHWNSVYTRFRDWVKPASRRQANTCCGCTCQRRATAETTAPGAVASVTIRALSAADQRRRPGLA